MAYDTTSWTLDGLTKAGATSTTTQSLVTGNLTATTLTLSSNVVSTLTVGEDDTGYDVKLFGATSGSYWLWDESADGVVQIGTLTVGEDDTGYDVKFFGATSGRYMLWDESNDRLELADNADIVLGTSGDCRFYHDGSETFILNGTGDLSINTLNGTLGIGNDVSGIAVSIGHTTSETTINDNLTVTGNLTVGVDDAGHDVKFFGATSGKYMLWDESEDKLEVSGNIQITGTQLAIVASSSTELLFSGGNIGNITSEGEIRMKSAASKQFSMGSNNQNDSITIDTSENVSITGGKLTVGENDTGYDVKFFGATTGAYMLWDESADTLIIDIGSGTDSPPLQVRGDSSNDCPPARFVDDGSGTHMTIANMYFHPIKTAVEVPADGTMDIELDTGTYEIMLAGEDGTAIKIVGYVGSSTMTIVKVDSDQVHGTLSAAAIADEKQIRITNGDDTSNHLIGWGITTGGVCKIVAQST